jgi:type II secretion system protein N
MRPVIIAVALLGCSQRSTPEEAETGAFNPDDVVHRTEDRIRVDVRRKDVPLKDMPIIAETLGGLPMSGLADVTIDLTIPKAGDAVKYKEINGTLAVSCPAGCTLGDGKAALAMGGLGSVQIGTVALGAVDIRAVVKDGHLTMNQFDMVSADFEMHATLRMDFAETLEASTVDGCLWFKPTEVLRKREPKTYAVIMTTGASVDAEGFFSIKLGGTVGGIKRLAQECRPKT